MSIIYGANVTNGLFPEHWDPNTGNPIGGAHVFLPGYLLNSHILRGQCISQLVPALIVGMNTYSSNIC